MVSSWVGPAAMVLTAVVALGCVLTSRPRRPVAVVASTGMLLAMADMALGHVLLSPVAWAGALVTLGVFTVALPQARDDHAAWHHGLALVAAAAILMASPHALPATGGAGHAAHPTPMVTSGWIVGLTVTVVYAVAALLPLRRTPTRAAPGPSDAGRGRQLVQVIATTGCLLTMAVLPNLG